jgi:hypothetical protein
MVNGMRSRRTEPPSVPPSMLGEAERSLLGAIAEGGSTMRIPRADGYGIKLYRRLRWGARVTFSTRVSSARTKVPTSRLRTPERTMLGSPRKRGCSTR